MWAPLRFSDQWCHMLLLWISFPEAGNFAFEIFWLANFRFTFRRFSVALWCEFFRPSLLYQRSVKRRQCGQLCGPYEKLAGQDRKNKLWENWVNVRIVTGWFRQKPLLPVWQCVLRLVMWQRVSRLNPFRLRTIDKLKRRKKKNSLQRESRFTCHWCCRLLHCEFSSILWFVVIYEYYPVFLALLRVVSCCCWIPSSDVLVSLKLPPPRLFV